MFQVFRQKNVFINPPPEFVSIGFTSFRVCGNKFACDAPRCTAYLILPNVTGIKLTSQWNPWIKMFSSSITICVLEKVEQNLTTVPRPVANSFNKYYSFNLQRTANNIRAMNLFGCLISGNKKSQILSHVHFEIWRWMERSVARWGSHRINVNLGANDKPVDSEPGRQPTPKWGMCLSPITLLLFSNALLC